MAKKILGLDLGTTSIGWAFITEAENSDEKSLILKIGVRVNPLTVDEQTNFEKGKPVSVNADRTLKRGMRRNLQRYKQRRENLIEALRNAGLINEETILAENEKATTHATYALRSNAATQEVSKEVFARTLLMINKKRGYKSSRKAKNDEEGTAIDGMAVAKRLYEENITPGQVCLQLLKEGKKALPDFYRSDLQAEFDKIWDHQKQFHPDFLTAELKKAIVGQGKENTRKRILAITQVYTADNKGTVDARKEQAYSWRSKAVDTELLKEQIAYVLAEVNNNINSSSGFLGAISDRSKELYFTQQTVGQYLYKQLAANPHSRLKNQVFYRQDYLDEFETIWEKQAQYHPELTAALKEEIRDIIIFYQRKLKSQKELISFCEFESRKIEVIEEGKTKTKTIGYRVTPKSSPLFQEFKIWQNLNHLLIQEKKVKNPLPFSMEVKQALFKELNVKGNLTREQVFAITGYNPKEYELNFKVVEGNRTGQLLYEAYFKMMVQEGHEEIEWKEKEAAEILTTIQSFFKAQNINPDILHFNAELDGKAFEQQLSFQLWHLLYSYEGDNSNSGNEKLYKLLQKKFGFKRSFAQILSNISFQDDYGSLSAKAIRKILPYLKAGHPFAKKDEEKQVASATALAGYNHSSSLTKEENDNRPLKDIMELLPKNSLRNPVVEKILNQMVNVVNTIIADPDLGKPDEIRIELARELKKNAAEREEMTAQINKATAEHEAIRQLLINKGAVKNPTRNDIIRYKLYQELKRNGYKTLYSDTYIPWEDLFSKRFDIEHIIPKALLFDDSFSNKTLCLRKENSDKGNTCAVEFVESYFGKQKLADYLARVEMMYKPKEEESISKAKYNKLLMKAEKLGEGFIERDLRNTQYIAKKARNMLQEICKTVVPTTGSVTDRLREDWDLINVMQEISIEKYRKLGLTEMVEKKDGGFKEKINDWTKRNDHRHHAMDALTIAFTKHSHIQYLNNLAARKKEDKLGREIKGIEDKETYLHIDDAGKRKRRFNSPLPDFREEAKKHLESVLVSFKAKNKVATKNKNKSKLKAGENVKTELTPRGQLHKETVYGKIRQYATKEEKVSAKFDAATIQRVASEKYRKALLLRLQQNGNDPKKAFTGKNSLDKNPVIWGDKPTQIVPEKVKLFWLEDNYTIRKDITPENFKEVKSIEKIVDVGIQNIMKERLATFNGNAKEAFSNLDKNPIWLNEVKGISIRRVTISGVKNVEPLHTKKDHLGKDILDDNGNKVPVDFVSTGNNHHVAIYRDAEGNLQDNVVSFYEVVERVRQGLPVVDKLYNQESGWQFLFTMKQNEYFIFPSSGFEPFEIDLKQRENYSQISKNLFRVQKFSKLAYGNSFVREYVFRHHLETSVDDKKELKDITFKNIKSLPYLEKIIKVKINHIGEIVQIGEY